MENKMHHDKRIIIAELIGLFFILPLFLALQNVSRPLLFSILIAACVYIVIRSFKLTRFKAFWHFPKDFNIWKGVFFRSIIILILSCLAMLILPHYGWFSLPKYSLKLWLLVMIFYPLISVLPQEIIWRFYLLEITQNIFPARYMRILISAFLFGWLHIIYLNVFSVIATIYLGLHLAYCYYKGEKSIWPLWVEHTIAGQIIFTIGLGIYFYNGSPAM